jgi:hypothetical protein
MKEASGICSTLVAFEERSALLYLTLARRFTAEPALSWFWLEMSMEEKQHATLLDFCGCQQLFGKDEPDKNTLRKLSNLLSELEERVKQTDLSVNEAFLIAAELEASELNSIYARMVRPIEGTWYIVRKKIETLIPGHTERLLRNARKFGVSGPVMARLMELSGRRPQRASS